ADMFKRLFWFTAGVGVGVGASRRINRKVRETVDRYRPERVAGNVTGAVRRLGGDMRDAVAEGRHAMAERESQLRAGR
ncbi:MAG: hypothetical protein ACRD0U_05490, partial [Acidimicrobiales bacterium]